MRSKRTLHQNGKNKYNPYSVLGPTKLHQGERKHYVGQWTCWEIMGMRAVSWRQEGVCWYPLLPLK